MDISIEPIPPEKLKAKPDPDAPLGFGAIFTDYMFTMDYHQDQGWHNPRIRKFENLSLSPAAFVLHYGQEIFEGLKAYRRADGRVSLFRPEKNFQRFNNSAKRLCMPEIPPEDQKKALFELLRIEKNWVPGRANTSLYIRPTMIGTYPRLGLKPSDTFLYYIILSPSDAYFSKGFLPVAVYVSDTYVRAAVGGTGTAKTGGNYAATLLAAKEAQKKGCDQVLWLDARERKYVEEVGSMNICFVINNKIVTSNLSGSILDGVTRDSVITLARSLGHEVEERHISIDEVIGAAQSGAMTESFGCGTAAVISPVGKLVYREKTYEISSEAGPVSKQLFTELTEIQYGRKDDPFGWVTLVD